MCFLYSFPDFRKPFFQMIDFFARNLDYLYFFYGSAFFLLGVACLIFNSRQRGARGRGIDWLSFGLFGLSHAVNEWLEFLAISYMSEGLFFYQRLAFLSISFFFLLRFAVNSYKGITRKTVAWYVYLLPFALFGIGLLFSGNSQLFLGSLSRFLLGFPASMSTAYVFWLLSGFAVEKSEKHLYKFIGAAFFLYSFPLTESGLSVFQVLPGAFFYNSALGVFFHLPPAFYRSMIATIIAFLLIRHATKTVFAASYDVGEEKGRKNLLVASFLLFYVFLFVFGYRLLAVADAYEKKHLRQALFSEARTLADIIGIAEIRSFISDEKIPAYKKYLRMHNRMTELAQISFYARSLYIIAPEKDNFSFTVGSFPQVFPFETSPRLARIPQKPVSDAFYSSKPTFLGPFASAKGRSFYSLFFPVVDQKGKVLVVLGMEIDASRIQSQINEVRRFVIGVCMLFLVPLVTGYAFIIVFVLRSLELQVQKRNLDKALLNLNETQKELARSEETFRGILNNSPNAIFGFDRDLRLIFWNHGAERLYGYKKTQVINEKDPVMSRRVTDVLGIPSMEHEVTEVFSGRTIMRDLLQKDREGHSLDVSFTAFPVKDPQGRILFALGLAQDISTHMRYEERLADANARLKSVLDGALQVSINTTDTNGKFQVWNRGSEQMLGYKADEVLGKSPVIIHDEADLREFEREINLRTQKNLSGFDAIVEIARQGGILERECVMRRKDKSTFPMDLTIAGLHNDKGELVGYIGIGIDRSRAKQAEEELRMTQEKYKDLVDNLNIGVFVSTPEPEGKLLEYNKACLKMFEADSEEEMTRLPLSERYQDKTRRAEVSRKILEQGYLKNEEVVLLTAKGRPVWVSISAVLRKDAEGRKYFYGVLQDVTEHKKLEQSLLEERDRLKKIADSIGAGLSLIDRDFRIIWVNDVLERWFGKSEHLRGKKCFETYQFRNYVCERCPSRLAMETGQVQTAEQRSVFPDGRVMDFLLICTPVKNERGEVVQVLELTLDITERKRMIEMLEFERVLTRNVIDSITDSLLVLDCDTKRILDANRVFLQQVGRKKEDVVGKKCFELNGHVSPACEACSFEEVRQGRTTGSVHTHRLPDGSMVYEDVTLAPLKDEKGRIIGIIHISRDITDRKRMEDELKRYSQDLEKLVGERNRALQVSELMFRNLFESARDGILLIDAQDGNVIDANPFVLDMLKCSREALVGRHYAEVPLLSEPEVFDNAFKELKGKDSVFYESSIKDPSGNPIDVELRASTYFVEKRKIIQCNIRDITERKKIEKVKTEFVSMVSHELRTPLSAIKEGVEIVADETQGKINKNQKECLGIALSNIKRLNRLIGDILDISKIQTNLLKVNPEECDVYEIVEQVYNLVKIEIEKRGLVFVTDCPKGLPKVWADRDRLLQVLMNLVNNAIKFTREKSRIKLSVRRDRDFVEFGIQDEGMGISPEEITRLFGKFVQLDSTLVRRVGGTGLGLYISRNLVEAMAGRIWVESKIGEGSTFKFTLPIKA